MRPVLKICVLLFVGLFLIGCEGDNPLSANAGEDFEIQVGQAPQFDGCASTGNIDNYRWTIVEAPDNMVEDSGKIIRNIDPDCSFTLETEMGIDEVGVWVVQLEISNSVGRRATDSVTVTVNE